MQNRTMNFKYRMHLCFSFTEPAAAIQNSRSHHRRGDVTSQPPSYSLGETAGNICPMLHIRREFCKWHLVMATQHFMNTDTETHRKGQCGHRAGAISVPAPNGSPGNLSQAAAGWE